MIFTHEKDKKKKICCLSSLLEFLASLADHDEPAPEWHNRHDHLRHRGLVQNLPVSMWNTTTQTRLSQTQGPGPDSALPCSGVSSRPACHKQRPPPSHTTQHNRLRHRGLVQNLPVSMWNDTTQTQPPQTQGSGPDSALPCSGVPSEPACHERRPPPSQLQQFAGLDSRPPGGAGPAETAPSAGGSAKLHGVRPSLQGSGLVSE